MQLDVCGGGMSHFIIKTLDLMQKIHCRSISPKGDFSIGLVLIHEVESPDYITDQDWDSRS